MDTFRLSRLLILFLKIDVFLLWLNLGQVPIFLVQRMKHFHFQNGLWDYLPFKIWRISMIIAFISKLKQRIYNREILLLTEKFML